MLLESNPQSKLLASIATKTSRACHSSMMVRSMQQWTRSTRLKDKRTAKVTSVVAIPCRTPWFNHMRVSSPQYASQKVNNCTTIRWCNQVALNFSIVRSPPQSSKLTRPCSRRFQHSRWWRWCGFLMRATQTWALTSRLTRISARLTDSKNSSSTSPTGVARALHRGSKTIVTRNVWIAS